MSRRKFLQGTTASLVAPALSACGGRGKEPAEGVPRSPFDEDSTADYLVIPQRPEPNTG